MRMHVCAQAHAHKHVDAKHVEIKILKYSCGYWDFPKNDDIKIIEFKYVFVGPCMPSQTSKMGYTFNECTEAIRKYKMIKSRK